jgi:mannose-6-phosphate isomerase-like protein (cupin superfamily)
MKIRKAEMCSDFFEGHERPCHGGGGTAVNTEPTIEKVNLAQKLALFTETWSPKIVGALNDAYVKVVKLRGEFVWHHHADEDEMFLVIKGRLLMRLRNQEIYVESGEFVIIPHGLEHLPVATEECHVLLVEPKTTINTGNVVNARTVRDNSTI